MINNKIDWRATKKNVIRYLSGILRPEKYSFIFNKPGLVIRRSDQFFGENTKPIEKFRQYLADPERKEFFYCGGGLLFLKRWFPETVQLLAITIGIVKLDTSSSIAFDAGYEYAKREPFLYDWQNNKGTIKKYIRNRRAFLLESHIRYYFKIKYPSLYIEPSNKDNYSEYAMDDFSFNLFGSIYNVDVKSYSYEKENGSRVAVIRAPKKNIIYIFGDVTESGSIIINGVAGGGWLRILGRTNKKSGLTHVEHKQIHNIECLLVMLNMAENGLYYKEYQKMFETTNGA